MLLSCRAQAAEMSRLENTNRPKSARPNLRCSESAGGSPSHDQSSSCRGDERCIPPPPHPHVQPCQVGRLFQPGNELRVTDLLTREGQFRALAKQGDQGVHAPAGARVRDDEVGLASLSCRRVCRCCWRRNGCCCGRRGQSCCCWWRWR